MASRMTAERYGRMTAGLRSRPGAVRCLRVADAAVRVVFYVAFAALLALFFLRSRWVTGACVAVTLAVGFAVLSDVRARVDAPRPYEALAIEPLLDARHAGASFPSRHVFSCMAIATCWSAMSVPACAVLAALGVAEAAVRVVGGVHFPRDVVVGALCGVATGTLALVAAIPLRAVVGVG